MSETLTPEQEANAKEAVANYKQPETLPDTLSGLLRVAVEDAQEAERRGYILNMLDWVYTYDDGNCSVCMAGAVIVRRANWAAPDNIATLASCGCNESDQGKYEAIDYMRISDFTGAHRAMHLPEPNLNQYGAMHAAQGWVAEGLGCPDRYRAPWPAYLEAADILEAAGL